MTLRLLLAAAGSGASFPYVPPDPPDPPDEDPDTPGVTDEFSGSTLAALQTFLDGVSDGAVVGLVADSTITGTGQVNLSGRALSIVGRGATISRTVAGTTPILLLDGGGGPYALYDLIVDGAKSSALGKWDVTYEHEHGIGLGGVVGFEAARCTVQNVGGDGLNLQGGNDQWTDGVRFHHGTFYNIGRMGIAFTDGARNVEIDNNNISQIGYYTIDFEPNGATVDGIPAGGTDVDIHHNTIGTKPYGDYPTDGSQALGYFAAATGASGTGPVKRITIRDNILTGGATRVGWFDNGVDCEDLVFTGNSSSSGFTATGDIGKCVSVDGCIDVTVTGNTQPCTVDADFVDASGSSGSVVTTPNTV